MSILDYRNITAKKEHNNNSLLGVWLKVYTTRVDQS